jgi:orotate phosphoribosyltransferase
MGPKPASYNPFIPFSETIQMPASAQIAQDFVAFAVEAGVLRFGEFKTKAGRLSPYFFNAGLFDDGAKLSRMARFYAQRLIASPLEFDMIFGPAYKGITLAAAVSIELARLGRNVPLPTTARKPRTTARAAPWSARRCKPAAC